jgi:galactokinase
MPDASSAPTSLPPFLPEEAFVEAPDALDGAGPPSREDLRQRARDLLVDRMGPSDPTVATAYACGTVGVQADQTHYSEGFGLFLPLRHGVAVAARRAEAPRVTFAGDDEASGDESEMGPPWNTVVLRVLQELIADQPIEVGVVSTVPGACRDGYFAALAVALMRALRALDVSTTVDLESVRTLRDDLVPLLAAEIAAALDQPYSEGYLLATFAGPEPAFTLVDTATREHLPVETEARTALRWAVLDPGPQALRPPTFHHRRREQAEEALRVLRHNGFEGLEAFRNLEHRDLERAVDVLPAALRPVVRHLVTENRRVQKHVTAMRGSDWQMIGALMLMSHASQRDHWESTPETTDSIVNEAERRTYDGLYGACMTGRAGAVLVAGRPQGFGREIGRLVDAAARRHTRPRILAA